MSPWLPQLAPACANRLPAVAADAPPITTAAFAANAGAPAQGVEGGPQMTPECAAVKMMLVLAYPDIPLGVPLAGEM